MSEMFKELMRYCEGFVIDQNVSGATEQIRAEMLVKHANISKFQVFKKGPVCLFVILKIERLATAGVFGHSQVFRRFK